MVRARTFVCVLLLASRVCADIVLPVRKCCPLHQQLTNLTKCADFDYERYDIDGRRRRRDSSPWWLSHHVALLDSATRTNLANDAVAVVAEPDAPPPCAATLIYPLLEPDEYAILADGRLLVNTDGVTVLNFPRGSYCADLLLMEDKERHVVLLCPCDHVPCVRKCCYPGTALSVVKNDAHSENATCETRGDPGDEWTPTLYDRPGGSVVNGSKHATLYGFPQASS